MPLDPDSLPRLGIAFMDEDHGEAFALFNTLEAATTAALAPEAGEEARQQVKDLYATFLQHSREHFGRENDIMQRYGFFALGPHSEEHRRVISLLENWQARLDDPDWTAFQGFISTDLRRWLVDHIATMDTATAHFLRGLLPNGM